MRSPEQHTDPTQTRERKEDSRKKKKKSQSNGKQNHGRESFPQHFSFPFKVDFQDGMKIELNRFPFLLSILFPLALRFSPEEEESTHPCGQFQGCSIVARLRTICVISGMLRGLPTMTAERQAREAKMDVNFGNRSCPGRRDGTSSCSRAHSSKMSFVVFFVVVVGKEKEKRES